jgi:thiol-disulfide isomerase/thioredoxin
VCVAAVVCFSCACLSTVTCHVAILCLVAAALLPLAASKVYWFEEPSNITALTNDDFDAFLGSHAVAVVEFYNPGCPICRAFAPEMERAVQLAQGHGMDVQFGKVNCDDERTLNDRFAVTLYPTLAVFKAGVQVGSFEGCPMTGEAVVAEVRRILKLSPVPHARELTTVEETTTWLFDRSRSDFSIQTTLVAFVPTVPTDGASVMAAFDASAAELVGKIRFAVVRSSEVLTTFNLATTSITLVLYKDFDEGREVYTGPATASNLTSWVLSRSKPIAQVINPHNIRRVQQSAKFILHVFVDERGVEDGSFRVLYLDALRTAGKALEANGLVTRGNYSLSIVNTDSQRSWLTPFHLKDAPLPSMGLMEVGTDKFYKFEGVVGTLGDDDNKPTLRAADVLQFVRAYLSGLMAPVPPTPDREL